MNRLSRLAISTSVAGSIAFFSLIASAQAQTYPSSQAAISDAAQLLQGHPIGTADPGRLTQVRAILDQVVQQFPSEDVAVQILLEQTVDGINIGQLDARLAEIKSLDSASSSASVPISSSQTSTSMTSITPADQQSESALHLSPGKIAGLQERLTLMGFDPKGIDGGMGPGTRGAISTWQKSQSIPATGYLDPQQWGLLQSQSDQAYATWVSNPANKSKIDRIANPPVQQVRQTQKRVWYRNQSGYYCRSVLFVAQWCQASRPANYPYE